MAIESPSDIRIHRNPEFCEGNQYSLFIQVPGGKRHTILVVWGLTDRVGNPTHVSLFELAIDSGHLSGDQEPTGGGTLDLNTYEIFGSLHYGQADADVQDKFANFMRRKTPDADCR